MLVHDIQCYLHRGSKTDSLLFELGVWGDLGLGVPLVIDLHDVRPWDHFAINAISSSELVLVAGLGCIPHLFAVHVGVPSMTELISVVISGLWQDVVSNHTGVDFIEIGVPSCSKTVASLDVIDYEHVVVQVYFVVKGDPEEMLYRRLIQLDSRPVLGSFLTTKGAGLLAVTNFHT